MKFAVFCAASASAANYYGLVWVASGLCTIRAGSNLCGTVRAGPTLYDTVRAGPNVCGSVRVGPALYGTDKTGIFLPIYLKFYFVFIFT